MIVTLFCKVAFATVSHCVRQSHSLEFALFHEVQTFKFLLYTLYLPLLIINIFYQYVFIHNCIKFRTKSFLDIFKLKIFKKLLTANKNIIKVFFYSWWRTVLKPASNVNIQMYPLSLLALLFNSAFLNKKIKTAATVIKHGKV